MRNNEEILEKKVAFGYLYTIQKTKHELNWHCLEDFLLFLSVLSRAVSNTAYLVHHNHITFTFFSSFYRVQYTTQKKYCA